MELDLVPRRRAAIGLQWDGANIGEVDGFLMHLRDDRGQPALTRQIGDRLVMAWGVLEISCLDPGDWIVVLGNEGRWDATGGTIATFSDDQLHALFMLPNEGDPPDGAQ